MMMAGRAAKDGGGARLLPQNEALTYAVSA
jgi:hypothetical protein